MRFNFTKWQRRLTALAAALLAAQFVIPTSMASATTTCLDPVNVSLKAVTGTQRTIDLKKLASGSASDSCIGGSDSFEAQLDANSPHTIQSHAAGDLLSPFTNSDSTNFNLDLLTSADGIYIIHVVISDGGFTKSRINITLTSTATAPDLPSCSNLAVYSNLNSPGTDFSLALNGSVGCSTSDNLGLTYTVSAPNHGSLGSSYDASFVAQQSVSNGTGDFAFKPDTGYFTPQVWNSDSDRASFHLTLTDAYGQTTTLTVFVIVEQPISSCTITDPKSEVLFNDPTASTAREFAITNRILSYIDCAGHGSVITMSWFSLTDMDFVYHLNAAMTRGANVRFLINSHAVKSGSTSYTAWNNLKAILGTNAPDNTRNSSTYVDNTSNRTAGSWALFCDHGCLTPASNATAGKIWVNEESEYPALHAKFFLISNIATSGSRVVSVSGVASSNPTRAQAVSGWNNAQIFVEKGNTLAQNPLFNSFNSYFQKLSAQGKVNFSDVRPAKANSYNNLGTKGATEFRTFPRVGSSTTTDDVTNLFKSVKCRYKDAKGKMQRTQIYMNMFVFTRNSPAIALWHLANNKPTANGGCVVRIIYTDMDQAIFANGSYIKGPGGNISWGVADCLSTAGTVKGKYASVTVPERRKMLDANGHVVKVKGKTRYQTVSVCKRGGLMGAMPTITKNGGYCWLNTKSKVSGGSISACVSTPLKLTSQDPADGRAKLEAWPDVQHPNSTVFSHQKYILINGMVGNAVQQVVYAGTPNLTAPGLRYNDEIMTITTGSSFYNAYLNNYNTMLSYIKNRPAPLPNPCRAIGTC